MKIYIGSDHAGFAMKEYLLKNFAACEVEDLGCYTEKSVDYPDFAVQVGEKVVNNPGTFGVLICGSGIGMSIAANKVCGVRAALCSCTDFARLSREHNNANIIVLPGRFISNFLALELLTCFTQTEFCGNRHQGRIDKISQYENKR